jgi:hypothetical protein
LQDQNRFLSFLRNDVALRNDSTRIASTQLNQWPAAET